MSDTAIKIEKLSKRYRIGQLHERHDTLRDALVARLKRLSRKTRAAEESSKRSETIWALHDISLEIQRGEVVGIVGRNGAGKSTLLKILSRITEPTSGAATIHGRVGSLLEVGTGFHPELTGRENIYLNGAILGMRRHEINRKFDEIIAFSEIEKFLDTPVKRYSSGMYVRLAFAVAAHLEPEVLLVDEVLAVGDASFQRKCLGKMSDVSGEGRTVVFVSHNMAAVQTLCQRAFWLESGQLKRQGEVSTVVSDYLSSGLAERGAREQVWPEVADAPGNHSVRLRRIAVQPQSGEGDDLVTMQTPLRIEVEYWNLLPEVHLHATVRLYNDEGLIAFSSSAGFDPDPVLHELPSTGLFKSVCYIPGDLLNSGFHRITLLFIRDQHANNYKLDNVIGFEVVDTQERRMAWYGKVPGVVQPKLVWQTTRISGEALLER